MNRQLDIISSYEHLMEEIQLSGQVVVQVQELMLSVDK
jgi:hypothetical protein